MADNEYIELRTIKPSLLTRLGTWLISKRPAIFPQDRAGVEKYLQQRELPQDAPMPDGFARRFQVERWQAAGHNCVTLHPKTGRGAKHILYFHGGGFVLPMLKPHWPLVAAMVEQTGASLTVPFYPVAPDAGRAVQDAVADQAYARLQREWGASHVVLAGDSAGGHMALSVALRSIANGDEQPGRLVLFAPWLDIGLADEDAREVEGRDVILRIDALRVMGAAWAGDVAGRGDLSSADYSPLYAPEGDLARLPPVQMFVGRRDLFVVDNRSFARRLHAAGGSVKLYEYEGAPHVFMAMMNTAETRDCLALVADFLRE